MDQIFGLKTIVPFQIPKKTKKKQGVVPNEA